MRTITFASAVGLVFTIFAVSGCARVRAETTLPLYDPKADLTFDHRMLGVWLPDSVCVKLCRGEGKVYTAAAGGMSWLVIFGDAANTADKPAEIHLVQIGTYTYFFAAPKADETGTSLTGCCKVEYVNDRIVLHGLNLQAVTDDLLKHPDALKHRWIERSQCAATTQASDSPDASPTTQAATQPATSPTTRPALYDGDLKITDTPAAVRAYLVKHQDDSDFFSDPVVLYRVAK